METNLNEVGVWADRAVFIPIASSVAANSWILIGCSGEITIWETLLCKMATGRRRVCNKSDFDAG